MSIQNILFYSSDIRAKSCHHRSTRGGGKVGGGGGWVFMEPLPRVRVVDMLGISKIVYFQWKAFDLPYKMRYILSVVTLLEAFDVTN